MTGSRLPWTHWRSPCPDATDETGEPLKRITIAISEEVHTQLKVACAARRLRMADVLRDWVEANVKTLEAA